MQTTRHFVTLAPPHSHWYVVRDRNDPSLLIFTTETPAPMRYQDAIEVKKRADRMLSGRVVITQAS